MLVSWIVKKCVNFCKERVSESKIATVIRKHVRKGLASASKMNLQPTCLITDLPQQQPLPLEIQNHFPTNATTVQLSTRDLPPPVNIPNTSSYCSDRSPTCL